MRFGVRGGISRNRWPSLLHPRWIPSSSWRQSDSICACGLGAISQVRHFSLQCFRLLADSIVHLFSSCESCLILLLLLCTPSKLGFDLGDVCPCLVQLALNLCLPLNPLLLRLLQLLLQLSNSRRPSLSESALCCPVLCLSLCRRRIRGRLSSRLWSWRNYPFFSRP